MWIFTLRVKVHIITAVAKCNEIHGIFMIINNITNNMNEINNIINFFFIVTIS